MSKTRSFLSETLAAWRDVRDGLIEEVENIPAAKFDFRPAPEVRSLRELIQHILEVALLMTGELTRPDTDFRRASWPKLLELYAAHGHNEKSKTGLIRLMRSQMNDAEQKFAALGEEAMYGLITNFDGSRWTKMQWLHHGIAQEMYHRGQIALYARLMGREPALTKRIRGG